MEIHRECILNMIKFIEEKYLKYSREYIRELLIEDKNDNRYNWFDAKHSFIYKCLHSDTIKVFIVGKN